MKRRSSFEAKKSISGSIDLDRKYAGCTGLYVHVQSQLRNYTVYGKNYVGIFGLLSKNILKRLIVMFHKLRFDYEIEIYFNDHVGMFQEDETSKLLLKLIILICLKEHYP